MFCHFFFFNDTATTEIYTLSLHDALPISGGERANVGDVLEVLELLGDALGLVDRQDERRAREELGPERLRSEEHTSELQSQSNLACRLLLEKKKVTKFNILYNGIDHT